MEKNLELVYLKSKLLIICKLTFKTFFVCLNTDNFLKMLWEGIGQVLHVKMGICLQISKMVSFNSTTE